MSVHRRAAERDHVLVVGGRIHGPDAGLLQLLEAQKCIATRVPRATAGEHAAARRYLLAIVRHRPGGSVPADVLQGLHTAAPGLRIAVTGPAGDVAGALAAMRARAFDYLEEPVTPPALLSVLDRAREGPDPRLASWLESLQALAPGLVHELRNPLSGILAGSQMLGRLLADQHAACRYAQIIREEARQLERLLARVAQFGRLQSRGARLRQTVDLAALLGRLLEEVRPACETRRIRIVPVLGPRVPAPQGDPASLGLAIGEVIRNAMEAMAEGGTLTVETRRAPGRHPSRRDRGDSARGTAWAQVVISDTGPGMPEEARHRACEPFFSTRSRALGIGLALAQAVALAHGGAVLVTDGAPAGARVILRLPAAPRADRGARRCSAKSTGQTR